MKRPILTQMLTIRNPKTLFLKSYFIGSDARQAIAKCKSHGVQGPGILGTLLVFYLYAAIKIKRKQVFGITGRQREVKAVVQLLFVRLKNQTLAITRSSSPRTTVVILSWTCPNMSLSPGARSCIGRRAE